MVDKETVRRGYDELAEDYAEQREEKGDGIEVLERVLAALPDDAQVLDAGCGQGAPVLRRICEGASGTGIDLSREQLRRAAEKAPDAALAQADMTRLPFESERFDAVTAYYSLIHIPEGDHQAVLDEFARVLAPEGRLLVIEGTREWRGANPNWLDGDAEMQWHIAGPDATRSQIRSAGFETVDEFVVGSSLAEESTWQLFEARL